MEIDPFKYRPRRPWRTAPPPEPLPEPVYPTVTVPMTPSAPVYPAGAMPVRLGWKCPGCGACYSPVMLACTRCVGEVPPNGTREAT